MRPNTSENFAIVHAAVHAGMHSIGSELFYRLLAILKGFKRTDIPGVEIKAHIR
jgi:hypothetical protein